MSDWWPAAVVLMRLLWTGMGIVSLGAGLDAWEDALLDRAALRRDPTFQPDGPRAILLRCALRTTRVRTGVQAGFVVVGLTALLAPVPATRESQWIALGSGAAFLAIEGALMWDAVRERIDRRQINHLLRQRDMTPAPRPPLARPTADAPPAVPALTVDQIAAAIVPPIEEDPPC